VAVGLVIGLAAAEPSRGPTNPNAEVPPRTVTRQGPTKTKTVTRPVVRTRTVTTGAPATGSGGGAGSEGSPTSTGGHEYVGSGNRRIATITVSRESMLRWHASGGSFSMKNSPEDAQSIAISSHAPSGETPIEPGTYHQVEVTASGEWSFAIRPG
jgi:hypothetical protein